MSAPSALQLATSAQALAALAQREALRAQTFARRAQVLASIEAMQVANPGKPEAWVLMKHGIAKSTFSTWKNQLRREVEPLIEALNNKQG